MLLPIRRCFFPYKLLKSHRNIRERIDKAVRSMLQALRSKPPQKLKGLVARCFMATMSYQPANRKVIFIKKWDLHVSGMKALTACVCRFDIYIYIAQPHFPLFPSVYIANLIILRQCGEVITSFLILFFGMGKIAIEFLPSTDYQKSRTKEVLLHCTL